MAWCEDEENVDYVPGLAKNSRLKDLCGGAMAEASAETRKTGKACRRCCEFTCRTQKSWFSTRRVVVEALPGSRGEDETDFALTGRTTDTSSRPSVRRAILPLRDLLLCQGRCGKSCEETEVRPVRRAQLVQPVRCQHRQALPFDLRPRSLQPPSSGACRNTAFQGQPDNAAPAVAQDRRAGEDLRTAHPCCHVKQLPRQDLLRRGVEGSCSDPTWFELRRPATRKSPGMPGPLVQKTAEF